jgi:predicted metal-dependent HD superfamily phosphohydrolase
VRDLYSPFGAGLREVSSVRFLIVMTRQDPANGQILVELGPMQTVWRVSLPEPPECVERVVALIQSTAHHSAAKGDAALLADIDLAILGAPPTRYRRYERDVRSEYAAVADVQYRAARARVLRGFLERLAIYRTPYFASRLEAQARSNLSNALSALDSDGGK